MIYRIPSICWLSSTMACPWPIFRSANGAMTGWNHFSSDWSHSSSFMQPLTVNPSGRINVPNPLVPLYHKPIWATNQTRLVNGHLDTFLQRDLEPLSLISFQFLPKRSSPVTRWLTAKASKGGWACTWFSYNSSSLLLLSQSNYFRVPFKRVPAWMINYREYLWKPKILV